MSSHSILVRVQLFGLVEDFICVVASIILRTSLVESVRFCWEIVDQWNHWLLRNLLVLWCLVLLEVCVIEECLVINILLMLVMIRVDLWVQHQRWRLETDN